MSRARARSLCLNSPGSLRVFTAGSTPANLIGVGQCLPVTPGPAPPVPVELLGLTVE